MGADIAARVLNRLADFCGEGDRVGLQFPPGCVEATDTHDFARVYVDHGFEFTHSYVLPRFKAGDHVVVYVEGDEGESKELVCESADGAIHRVEPLESRPFDAKLFEPTGEPKETFELPVRVLDRFLALVKAFPSTSVSSPVEEKVLVIERFDKVNRLSIAGDPSFVVLSGRIESLEDESVEQ